MKVKFVGQSELSSKEEEAVSAGSEPREFEIKPDQSVMQLAHEQGIFIKSVCNGLPSCAECRVRIVEGEHNVLPPSNKELSLIGTGYFIDRRRLSCQLKCFGDVVIDLSEQEKKAKDSLGPKRPQGHIRKDDNEESRAITGNLIEQDDDMKSVKVDESPRREGRRGSSGGQRTKSSAGKSSGNKSAAQKSGDQKNKSRGRRKGNNNKSGNSKNSSRQRSRRKKSDG